MKLIILALLTLSATACVMEGPPYDNVRNQRAQESARDRNDDGYYNNDERDGQYEHGHDQVHRHDD